MSSFINRTGLNAPYAIGNHRTYQIQNRRDSDRKEFSYLNRLDNQNTSNGKTNYKYSYYKDPAQYHYHSKEGKPQESYREKDNTVKDLFGVKKQHALSHSPSFRKVDYKSRQFLDSIDNIIQSHRSKHSQLSIEHNNYEAQSEQILFLKQKLIQTHHKLLKQLEQTNRLTFQVETLQAELKQNIKLAEENEELKRELEIIHSQLDQRFQRTQEKYRSLENKAYQQSKRNTQLKDDLQNMRNKMLQTLMLKNTYEEQNAAFKNQQDRLQKIIQKLKQQIRQKDQTLQYKQKQFDLLKKKYQKCERECEDRAQQIHQYSHLAAQRQKIINSLQNQLKTQKDRNLNSVSEFGNLQAQYKATLKRLNEVEDLCQKYKGEIYWFQKNKQSNDKLYKDKLEKLTQEYNVLNMKFREKEKEIQNLKRKPVFQAQKKKRNYENTRQFVNRLQNQQINISQSRVGKAQSKGSARGNNSNSKLAHNQTTSRNTSKSPFNKNNITQNPITHEPITHRISEGYSQQKSKYISMLSQVGDLQQNLLNCNLEKKKILSQMDKIDATKVKTKDMINKRRKLQDQLTNQQQKIKRVKEQLRRIKAL